MRPWVSGQPPTIEVTASTGILATTMVQRCDGAVVLSYADFALFLARGIDHQGVASN
jgi:hypothetical protein